MRFTVSELPQQAIYKLLTATVTPRPISWVTTCDRQGNVNAAPFSFFNIMGSEPPLAVFSVGKSNDKDKKDTIANILDTNEFVVNLVPARLAEAMNLTAMDAPYGFDEIAAAGLTITPSHIVQTPQIAQSPVSFECVNHATMLTGPKQYMVIGRVVEIRIDDAYIQDAERHYVDTKALDLIGRMHGSGGYTRCHDLFEMKRISYAQWKDQSEN